MVIKLTPDQIPKLWEIIKYAAVNANNIDKKSCPSYLYRLLHKLLSSRAQCFIVMNDKRVIVTVYIIQFIINDITGDKYLSIQSMHSFEAANIETRKEQVNIFKKLAEKEQCKYIHFTSCSEDIWNLSKMLGFQERSRNYVLGIEE